MKDKAKKTTNTKDTGKVFDVTRPGKTTVSATSRPVIVGHKPQVKDPMMAKHDDEEQALLDSTQKVIVQPVAEADRPIDQDEPSLPATAPPVPAGPDTTSEPAADTAPSDTAETPTIASVAVTGSVEKPVSEPTAPELAPDLAADIVSDESPTNPKSSEEAPDISDHAQTPTEFSESEAVTTEPASQPESEKSNSTVGVVFEEPAGTRRPMEVPEGTNPLPVLPDEPTPQTIIVAHHTPKASAGKIFLIIFLVLIFAAIVLDVLLDAGFIVLSGIPHTDFF